MAGAFVGVTSKRYNIAPSELAKMELRRETEETQGESFGQPVNPGVNLGQKVPILDLSGKIHDAQQATPQELLDFLKAEFVGKEPSISADGEAMIGLPSNSAAKHVVRSSWKGLTYEDMDTRTAGLMSLRDVLQNATLIESHPNQKASKTHLKNIHRFYIPVWSSDGLKTLRIVAHESKTSDGRTPVEVDLNDLIVERQDESPARLSGTPLSGVLPERQLRGAFQVTIADMLRGVNDAEGNPYVGEKYDQTAYHGSPHRGIKKMSLQHIGTGEGNQVFGYGIYSAQARGTAESYREALTKGRADAREHVVFSNERGEYSYKDGAWIGPDGEKVSPAGERILTSIANGRLYSSESLKKAVARYKEIAVEDLTWGERNASDYRQEIAKLEEKGKAGSDRHEELKDKLSHTLNQMELWKQDLDWLNANLLENEVITPNDGQLYRLEVPENDVLLDWDKPISEQPEKVKAAIQEIAEELTPEDIKQLGGNTDMFLFEGMTGQQLYAMLAWLPSIGSEKAASMLLLKHGVPGLRYLDALSRGKGEGTHNFVVWDEDAMSIEETYYQTAYTGSPHRDVDKEYFAALEAGDLETAQRIVDEQAKQKGYGRDSGYRMNHQAPNSEYDENLATIRESDLVPDNYWTKPQRYLYTNEDYEAFYAVKRALVSPSGTIRMYRAIPKGVKESEFRNGDWITPSRAYAQREGLLISGGYRIITQEVKTKDVWWDGNSICEFGFDDGKGYAYKNTKNNRKLTEVIVRDHDGAIIPPSRRFNARRSETYYQRQSPEYDPSDPKTWPKGPARDEALDLLSDIEVLRMGAMHPNTWTHDERRAKEALEIMRRKDRLGDVKQDPHTWTEGFRKEDALVYQGTLDEDGEVELDPNTWMAESPYRREALSAFQSYVELGKRQEHGETLSPAEQEAYDKAQELLFELQTQEQERVDACLEELQEEEFKAVDEEMDRLDDRYSTLEDKESNAMMAEAEDLQDRLDELIEQETAAPAEEKLAQDEKAWAETVDNFIAGRLQQNRPVRVMTTPIALRLASDEDVGFKEIVTSPAVLKKILKDKHVEITPDILKQLPRAMADPIMVFKSATVPGSYVSMLELKDSAGGTIIVPVALNASAPGKQAFMTSVYGQIRKKADGDVELQDSWFVKQIESGNLRYINTKKSASWARDVGLQLPIMSLPAEALRELNIPTEADLVKARIENPGFYQGERQDESTSNARLTVKPGGVSLIEFFKSANRSTSFHELAHHMFRVIYELSKRDGVDPQLIQDVDTILREAGVTREEFDSDNAEVRKAARTKAHEFFARGFEVYISEGKAPSKELRGVFRRLRAWMIEVYRDVVQALGIELSDEMRGVYDRLLAMPEEIDAETTVRELAVEEAALKEEIQRHEAEMREREAQERISAEGGEEWATLELPENATEVVDGWLSELESYEIGRAARAEVRKTLDHIREEGGLNFERLVHLMGDEAAGELRKKLGNFYFTSKKALSEGRGLPLDVLAEALGMDESGLVTFLEGIEGGKLKKPAPLLEVNTDTLNALVDRLGVEGARSYLKDRARYLTKQQRAIQQEYEKAASEAEAAEKEAKHSEQIIRTGARYTDENMDALQESMREASELRKKVGQVKADLEATYREQKEIADGLRALEGTLKAEADIAPEVSIEPVSLTPESGRSIDEAEDSELLLTADGSTELGRIDEDVANAAGIAAGEIQANVGAVRHAEEGHGAQILGAGYPDATTFIFDVLSGYEKIFRGSNESLLLGKPLGDHHAIAAIELVNEDGVYRTKTGWVIREKALNKKELLFARSEPLATDPGAGVVSRTGPSEGREDTAPNARQKSNSGATVSPGKGSVNPMLSLSEAMRRGYEMAEKYARAAFKAGREAEAEKLVEFKEKAAERLAGFKDRAAEKLGRVKEEVAGKLDELEVKRRLQLGSERAKAAMKRAKLKKEAAERIKSERAKAQMRIVALKQKLQERQALKKEVNKLVKGINKMAKSESITWARHKELEKLLADYDLKKRSKKTLEHRAEVAQWLRDDPEFAEALNEKDTAHLGETTLNDMTLDDLRTLNEKVQQIYDRGHEEFKVWDLERTERRDTIHSELVAVLKKRKTHLPKIVTKPEDIKKQYKGITGKLVKGKDWMYAATLGPDRFFDWLDKGATDYTGAFVRYLVDEVNKQRDVALRHIFERRKWMEDRLRPLGFRMSDFTRIAATVEGKDFTWDDIMEIYIGMRNDKKGRAILYGNLKNMDDPEGTVAHLIGLLTEDHKKAAELVVEDHNRNVDRIEAGLIHAFQKGMDRETDYTSIHRLEHLSSMGLIDAESAEALTDGMADAGVLRRVEDGFMKKRVEIKDENQTPIKLGLFNNWHEDVSRHEHSAAMAATARDIAGALLMRNPVDGQTIGRMVKERFGDEAWRTLVDFVNTNVTDDARLAHSLLDGMCNTMMKNMVIAYLAGNLGTVLKQTTSIPRFLITAGPHRILVSIAQFLTQGPKFLEKVYELDPQMRDRMGSPILTMLKQDPRWGRRMCQRGLDWMLAPISMMDRWVAAIGWKATYDANVKRLGHEGAIREAQRAVRLTQQPASAKDAARMWRQNGFVRLAMIFTSDAAQTFGMTAYDLVQQLRSGKLVRAFSTLMALALTGILMKAASEGLPSDEDDEDEDRSWVLSAFMEQFISSIPLVGKEAMVLYDNLSGKYRGSQYSAIVTPIEKIARAYRLWTDEDSDEEDFRRATWLALEALTLSGAAPVPVTGIKRIVQSLEMAEEDGAAAALNMFGVRRRLQ